MNDCRIDDNRRRRLLKLMSYTALILIGVLLGILLYFLYYEAPLSLHIQVISSNATNVSTILRHPWLPEQRLQTQYVVPNTVHFIWFADDGKRPLTFINYISMRSAYVIHRPDTIMLHCNHLPSGHWWQRLRKEVPLNIVHRIPPEMIHGQRLGVVFHRGDVAKYEVLLEYGGIYLDYDVIVVNSLNPLRCFDATFGKEKLPKLIAGIIISRRNSTFLRLLHESYRNNYRPWDWDYNCAWIAYGLAVAHPDLINVEPYRLTTPDWIDRRQLWNDVIDWSDLYVVHVMAHFEHSQEKYTPDNIRTINSTFGQLMRYIYYGTPQLLPGSSTVQLNRWTTIARP